MNNDIIKILNIIDEDIEILETTIVHPNKYIHIRKKVVGNKMCPNCGCVMYSKGVRKREINHPVLQDGFHLYLIFIKENGDVQIVNVITTAMTTLVL